MFNAIAAIANTARPSMVPTLAAAEAVLGPLHEECVSTRLSKGGKYTRYGQWSAFCAVLRGFKAAMSSNMLLPPSAQRELDCQSGNAGAGPGNL